MKSEAKGNLLRRSADGTCLDCLFSLEVGPVRELAFLSGYALPVKVGVLPSI